MTIAQTGMFDDDERFDAEITIHYSFAEYSPSKKAPWHVVKTKRHIKGKLSCQLMTFLLKSYVNNPSNRAKCTASMHCPILSGSSNYTEYNEKGEVAKDVNFPLHVSVTRTGMDEKSNKLVTTSTYSASGVNEMEMLKLEIKHYDAPFGQIQPIAPHYVIWLTGGKDLKYIRSTPTGNGNGKKWDDMKEMLVPMEGPFEINIPGSINEYHEVEAPEVYEQLLITNYKELDNFLLNPKAASPLKHRANVTI
ncbi:MAG: hypothetical protein HC830_02965 [Bacteroidetes bacterium]|nr:hypothetical protein [Bacteroidota bacterium]